MPSLVRVCGFAQSKTYTCGPGGAFYAGKNSLERWTEFWGIDMRALARRDMYIILREGIVKFMYARSLRTILRRRGEYLVIGLNSDCYTD